MFIGLERSGELLLLIEGRGEGEEKHCTNSHAKARSREGGSRIVYSIEDDKKECESEKTKGGLYRAENKQRWLSK